MTDVIGCCADAAGSASGEVGWLHSVADLGPIATALAALAALTVGVMTVRQRRVSDARAEWWRRAEWAFDQVLSTPVDESRASVGLSVLNELAKSELAQADELLALEAAWRVWLFAMPDEAAEQDL